MAFNYKINLDNMLGIPEIKARVMVPVMAKLVIGVQNMVKDAKKDSPVRGGHRTFNPNQRIGGTNRQSITWRKEGMRLSVVTQSGYGGYLEVGTRKMPARPYILPVYERNKTPIMNSLRGLI